MQANSAQNQATGRLRFRLLPGGANPGAELRPLKSSAFFTALFFANFTADAVATFACCAIRTVRKTLLARAHRASMLDIASED